jgi:hypothetical protein
LLRARALRVVRVCVLENRKPFYANCKVVIFSKSGSIMLRACRELESRDRIGPTSKLKCNEPATEMCLPVQYTITTYDGMRHVHQFFILRLQITLQLVVV